MRLFVYGMRMFDEKVFFDRFSEELGIEIGYTESPPSIFNYALAKGYDAITVLTNKIGPELMDAFRSIGVRLICTRTIGYDHIDLAHASKTGMAVCNVTYDPIGVAEFTVMLMLMTERKVKMLEARNAANDFRLNDMLGKAIGELRIGIIGAGLIGVNTLRILSGFGCELVYYNRSPSEAADRYARRVGIDELLSTCDIVSMHLQLNDETHHFLNADSFSKMKDGAVVINTGRGSLIDTEAMISALESGKLGGAGIDVIEKEFHLYYYDMRGKDLDNPYLDRLRAMDNVILFHHMAFYCETSVRGMVHNCLLCAKALEEGRELPHRLA